MLVPFLYFNEAIREMKMYSGIVKVPWLQPSAPRGWLVEQPTQFAWPSHERRALATIRFI